jgi:hypothetical protein
VGVCFQKEDNVAFKSPLDVVLGNMDGDDSGGVVPPAETLDEATTPLVLDPVSDEGIDVPVVAIVVLAVVDCELKTVVDELTAILVLMFGVVDGSSSVLTDKVRGTESVVGFVELIF